MSKPSRPRGTVAPKAAISALLQQGLALHQSGRPAEAAPYYERVLAMDAAHPAANHLLGLVRLAQGRTDEAVRLIARAVAAEGANAQYLGNLGVALNAAGRNQDAAVALRCALAINPEFAEAYANLGMALRALGQVDDAVDAQRSAVGLKPGEPGFHFNLGNALRDAGDIIEAESAYRRAIALRPNYSAAINALAMMLDDEGRSSEALALVEAALRALPDDAQLRMRRARSLRYLNRLEPAVESFDRALELNPGFGEAHLQRSYAVRHEHRDAPIKAMERLFRAEGAPLEDRIFVGFGLGKALTDLGEHREAIDVFTEANRLHRQRTPFSLDSARAGLKADIDRFEGVAAPLEDAGFREGAPIFVVGLPRSGKTTIEAILARHPTVAAAGELPTMGRLVRELLAEHPGARAREIPPQRFTELGRAYMREAERFVPAGKVPVDTMPSNYRHVGFIRLALPNARIVVARRQPAEHCAAIFEKYLTSRGYEYANDMDELQPYHAAFGRLIEAWHDRFPGQLHDIDLGSLAADREGGTRKLLEFCGLDWDSACLVEQRSEPQYRDWSPDRVAGNHADHMAAWREVRPQLWDWPA
ncbi:MAG: hypothetical protein JWQ89_4530 [Devosia sp.]|uniref:tetratricopeptide repeat-containing sulfotransferase family protein n=1 Tax=Devosia sp. TaxID=1871048 RepID=UPI0026199A82|nr:tetratricopeptide repeat-containing sulfotransferase family protein [Devosia sp.]MDB5542803.1 hypothetical protein [Devosia sp.]